LHTRKKKTGKILHQIHSDPNPAKQGQAESVSGCVRCGTCCRKGGPCFHHADRSLIDEGKIPCEFLFTIRKGETAWDNVRCVLYPQTSDIIKIKSRENSSVCIFLNDAENACTIYSDRPLECRVLNCRDTREIEKIYAEKRLTRQDLLGNVQGLRDIVEMHQARCDYDLIREIIADPGQGNRKALEKIGEMVQYDFHIRSLTAEKGGKAMEKMTDFLFGRPLWKTLEPIGIKIKIDGERVCIMPAF